LRNRHDEPVAPTPSQHHVGPVRAPYVAWLSTRLAGRTRTRDAAKAHVCGDRYQTADPQDDQHMHGHPHPAYHAIGTG
jgi:hypothetical protein